VDYGSKGRPRPNGHCCDRLKNSNSPEGHTGTWLQAIEYKRKGRRWRPFLCVSVMATESLPHHNHHLPELAQSVTARRFHLSFQQLAQLPDPWASPLPLNCSSSVSAQVTRFSADKRVAANVMVSVGKRQAPAFRPFISRDIRQQSSNNVRSLCPTAARSNESTLCGALNKAASVTGNTLPRRHGAVSICVRSPIRPSRRSRMRRVG
jgi:hypothetical protein